MRLHACMGVCVEGMGWLRLVGSVELHVSFAKEPYKRDYILQKRPVILRSLLIVATAYVYSRYTDSYVCIITVCRGYVTLMYDCVVMWLYV